MKKEEKYLAMTDSFLRQSSKGELPDKITQDLRFCMDEQQEKLQQKVSRFMKSMSLTMRQSRERLKCRRGITERRSGL